MKRVIFFLMLFSIVVAAGEELQCCPNLDQYLYADSFVTLKEGSAVAEIEVFYDNQESGLREPVEHIPIFVYVLDKEKEPYGGSNAFYKITTNANGKATFDLGAKPFFDENSVDPLEIVFFYCPLECNCMNCFDTYNIPKFHYHVCNYLENEVEDENIACSLELEQMIPIGYVPPVDSEQNPALIFPFHTSVIYYPPTRGVVQFLDFSLCLPLMLIFALLGGALYLSGRNPFAGFDFSSPRMKKSYRYRASGRGVYFSWSSVASAPIRVYKGVQREMAKSLPKKVKESASGTGTSEEKDAKSGRATMGKGRKKQATAAEEKMGMVSGETGKTFLFSPITELVKHSERKKAFARQLERDAGEKGAKYGASWVTAVAAVAEDAGRKLLGGLLGPELMFIDQVVSSIPGLEGRGLGSLIVDAIAQISTSSSDALESLEEMQGTTMVEFPNEGKFIKKLSIDENGNAQIEYYETNEEGVVNFNPSLVKKIEVKDDGSVVERFFLFNPEIMALEPVELEKATIVQKRLIQESKFTDCDHCVVQVEGQTFLRLMEMKDGKFSTSYFNEKGQRIDESFLPAKIQEKLGKATLADVYGNLQILNGFLTSSKVKTELGKLKATVVTALPAKLDQKKLDELEFTSERYEEIKQTVLSLYEQGYSTGQIDYELGRLFGEKVSVEKMWGSEKLSKLEKFGRFSTVVLNIQTIMYQTREAMHQFKSFNKGNDVIGNLYSAAYANSFGASLYTLETMSETGSLKEIDDKEIRKGVSKLSKVWDQLKSASPEGELLQLTRDSIYHSIVLETERAKTSAILYSIDPTASLVFSGTEELTTFGAVQEMIANKTDSKMFRIGILTQRLETATGAEKKQIQKDIAELSQELQVHFTDQLQRKISFSNAYDALYAVCATVKEHGTASEQMEVMDYLKKLGKMTGGKKEIIVPYLKLLRTEIAQATDSEGRMELSKSLSALAVFETELGQHPFKAAKVDLGALRVVSETVAQKQEVPTKQEMKTLIVQKAKELQRTEETGEPAPKMDYLVQVTPLEEKRSLLTFRDPETREVVFSVSMNNSEDKAEPTRDILVQLSQSLSEKPETIPEFLHSEKLPELKKLLAEHRGYLFTLPSVKSYETPTPEIEAMLTSVAEANIKTRDALVQHIEKTGSDKGAETFVSRYVQPAYEQMKVQGDLDHRQESALLSLLENSQDFDERFMDSLKEFAGKKELEHRAAPIEVVYEQYTQKSEKLEMEKQEKLKSVKTDAQKLEIEHHYDGEIAKLKLGLAKTLSTQAPDAFVYDVMRITRPVTDKQELEQALIEKTFAKPNLFETRMESALTKLRDSGIEHKEFYERVIKQDYDHYAQQMTLLNADKQDALKTAKTKQEKETVQKVYEIKSETLRQDYVRELTAKAPVFAEAISNPVVTFEKADFSHDFAKKMASPDQRQYIKLSEFIVDSPKKFDQRVEQVIETLSQTEEYKPAAQKLEQEYQEYKSRKEQVPVPSKPEEKQAQEIKMAKEFVAVLSTKVDDEAVRRILTPLKQTTTPQQLELNKVQEVGLTKLLAKPERYTQRVEQVIQRFEDQGGSSSVDAKELRMAHEEYSTQYKALESQKSHELEQAKTKAQKTEITKEFKEKESELKQDYARKLSTEVPDKIVESVLGVKEKPAEVVAPEQRKIDEVQKVKLATLLKDPRKFQQRFEQTFERIMDSEEFKPQLIPLVRSYQNYKEQKVKMSTERKVQEEASESESQRKRVEKDYEKAADQLRERYAKELSVKIPDEIVEQMLMEEKPKRTAKAGKPRGSKKGRRPSAKKGGKK